MRDFTAQYARAMQSNLIRSYTADPSGFTALLKAYFLKAHRGAGTTGTTGLPNLLTAIIAGTKETGELLVYAVEIPFSERSANPILVSARQIPLGLCQPCVLGGEIAVEFAYVTSERARAEARQWKHLTQARTTEERDILLPIRLVDLTIAYLDKSKSVDVGGKVDAIELKRGGGITWIQRKPTCQTN